MISANIFRGIRYSSDSEENDNEDIDDNGEEEKNEEGYNVDVDEEEKKPAWVRYLPRLPISSQEITTKVASEDKTFEDKSARKKEIKLSCNRFGPTSLQARKEKNKVKVNLGLVNERIDATFSKQDLSKIRRFCNVAETAELFALSRVNKASY